MTNISFPIFKSPIPGINNHPVCQRVPLGLQWLMTIRLVLFDAFNTLVTPRAPIFIQYASVFEPHLGKLNPDAIKSSFKIGEILDGPFMKTIQFFMYMKKALKQVQIERPAYANGAPEWWGEVIRRTARGAGADPTRKLPLPADPES